MAPGSLARVHLISLAAVCAIAAVIWALRPGAEAFTLRVFTAYMAFVHFAVGYWFFFTSSGSKKLLHDAPGFFWGRAAVAGAFGLSIYVSPVLAAAMYPLAFLHFSENALFMGHEIGRDGRSADSGPPAVSCAPFVSTAAIAPLMLALVAVRVAAEHVWRTPSWHVGILGAVFIGFLATVALQTGSASLVAARRALWPNALVLAWLVLVAATFPDGSLTFDLFILWHFATWIVFTWMHRPAARARLLQAHVVACAIYAAPVWLAFYRSGSVSQVVVLLAGPLGYIAQTWAHIVFTLLFRDYHRTPARLATVSRSAELAHS